MKNVVLLIPSLDPNYKLVRTVGNMREAGFERILLVNDGSDSDHMEPFKELAQLDGVEVIGYEVNQGKGHALKTGFKHILDNYNDVECVITADGDGQHLAKDCIKTAQASLDRDEIVIGCRDFSDPSVPAHNKAGNTISIFVYNYLCGIKVSDTQTGLRAFPVRYLADLIQIEGERFEYETKMFIYLSANEIPFSEVKIATVYEQDSNEGSHFRVVSDSVKVYKPILKYGGTKFVKFGLGSSLSAILDLGLFTIVGLFNESIPLATLIARVCSSIFNYCYNRGAVFKRPGQKRGSVYRYYALAACQLFISALLVTEICDWLSIVGFARTAIKFVVDVLLFFVSFKIQREWVFK